MKHPRDIPDYRKQIEREIRICDRWLGGCIVLVFLFLVAGFML